VRASSYSNERRRTHRAQHQDAPTPGAQGHEDSVARLQDGVRALVAFLNELQVVEGQPFATHALQPHRAQVSGVGRLRGVQRVAQSPARLQGIVAPAPHRALHRDNRLRPLGNLHGHLRVAVEVALAQPSGNLAGEFVGGAPRRLHQAD
jgi:hypothetical protein